MMLSWAAAALMVAAAFLVSLARPWAGAAVVLALLPWDGLAMDLGVRLTAYRLALFGWLGALILLGGGGESRHALTDRLPRLSFWGVAFLAYASLWTILQVFWIPADSVSGGVMRTTPEVRSLVQVIWLLLRFGPLLLLPLGLAYREQAVDLARVYLFSLAVLAAVGWVQVSVWWMTGGIDIAPIGGVEDLLGSEINPRHGIVTAFGQRILRMSSFGGEPKGTGQSLAVGLLLLQGAAWAKVANWRKIAILWLLLATAMIATLSTSAFYVWGGGTVFLAGYFLLKRPRRQLSASAYIIGLLGVCALLLAGGSIAWDLDPAQIEGFLAARTIERMPIEDFDRAVLGFLRDEPGWGVVGVGLGNIHVYASPYIPDFARHYMESEIFVAKSGYLRLISEVGLVGLFLFAAWMWREITLFRRAPILAVGRRTQERIRTMLFADFHLVAVSFGLVMVLAFMARGYLWNEMIWAVAVLRALRVGGLRGEFGRVRHALGSC